MRIWPWLAVVGIGCGGRPSKVPSNTVPERRGAPEVLLVRGGAVVLSAEAQAAWAGAPTLVDGAPIEPRPADCDDDPPDYETDNQRYFECEGTDPNEAYGEFSVTAPVMDAVPASLTSWIGRQVRVGAGASACVATIARLEIRAERGARYADLTDAPDDADAIAEAVLASGAPVVVGVLDPSCAGGWAVPADVQPVEWPIEDAPAEVADALRGRVGAPDEGQHEFTVQVARGPGDRALAIAWFVEECEDVAAHAIFLLDGATPGDDAVYEDYDRHGVVAVVDTGGAHPAIVFDDGVATWSGDATEGYEIGPVVASPSDVPACGD